MLFYQYDDPLGNVKEARVPLHAIKVNIKKVAVGWKYIFEVHK